MQRAPRWWAGKGPAAKQQTSGPTPDLSALPYLQRAPRWWADEDPSAEPQISRSSLDRPASC
ncbi:hypothetical protein EIQ03_17260 [Xanthomonas campestris pv. raphani]